MIAFPKSPRQQNMHLREMARKHGCQMRWVPGCLGDDTSTTVLAHSNSAADGKGMGRKANDESGVYACWRCHAELDQGRAPKDQKAAAFREGQRRQLRLFKEIAQSPTSKPRDIEAATWALDRLEGF